MMRKPIGPSSGQIRKSMPPVKASTFAPHRLRTGTGFRGFAGPSARQGDHVSRRAPSAQSLDLVSVALCSLILLSLYIFVL